MTTPLTKREEIRAASEAMRPRKAEVPLWTSILIARLLGPLFTTSLSSVQPQLYSHGSALLGSVQQVAGAAGVALFVALMSAQTAALTTAGTAPVEALAGGIRLAFMVGAVIAMFAFVAALFVQRPAPQAGGWGH